MTDETTSNLLERLAACVCEDGEATLADIRAGFAASIDQTLLDPTVGPAAVVAWAHENADAGFATLCVQPYHVARVAWELLQAGSPTGVCCALSFPHGQDTMEGVCFQVALALAAGATELDLVMNYGAFLEGSFDEVAEPIEAALRTIDAEPDDEDDECDCEGAEGACDCDCAVDADGGCSCGSAADVDDGRGCGHDHAHGCGDPDCDCGHDHHAEGFDRPALKVILETGCLAPEQICQAADLVSSLGVDFIETSTGFGPRDASVEDVRLMCATAEPGVQVKAAGDIRTLAEAVALLEAGATRLGTPHGRELLAAFDTLAAICMPAGEAGER